MHMLQPNWTEIITLNEDTKEMVTLHKLQLNKTKDVKS